MVITITYIITVFNSPNVRRFALVLYRFPASRLVTPPGRRLTLRVVGATQEYVFSIGYWFFDRYLPYRGRYSFVSHKSTFYKELFY